MIKALFFQRVPALFRKEFFVLLNERVDVYLATGQPSETENMKCFDEIPITYYTRSDIRYYLKDSFMTDKLWRNIISKISPDIVVITPTPRMITNYVLVVYCKIFHIPIVGWGMGEMPNRKGIKREVHATLQKTLVRMLDGIVCYSTTAKEYYLSLGVKSVTVAHNSIDTNKSIEDVDLVKSYSIQKVEGKAAELGIKLEKNRLVYLGRIIPSKHLDKIITSAKGLKNTQIVVVGSGDAAYVDSIKKMAEEMKVDVTFVGYKSGVELAEVMYLSDVFVLPSLGGLAINHAMSFGLPCIVSQGDGTERDLVTDGVNGYIFKAGDFQHMRKCIEKSINCKDLQKMGAASKAVIENSININTMVFSMEAFITEHATKHTTGVFNIK